ncbi:MAG: spermidine/putrescine ABC transporter substrate-binding protein [Ruminococcaceae bacterium]|nr:spermidine/putrescine ABC transporter substrate-binding protein [Oscillospiraceae bacterium]
MKKHLFFLTALCLVLVTVFSLSSCSKEENLTLNVYNWGEYISDGSYDSLNVNEAFEEYYYETYGVKVTVNYTTYASNEDMYNKIKAGATSYDIIIPSEYMIEKMIKENMLLELNFDNIPNFKHIDDNFKNLFYDPENLYSVPYTYGMVGIIYNDTMVDEEDVGGWDLLWNEKYEGKILQFNNPRDAFGTSMYRLGIDVNTTDEELWKTALEQLKIQKPLVQSYVMDEIFNKMKNGSAAIAPYYAGDYLTMYEDNDSLCFYYPEEGTNVFVDAMCIPSCASNKELAEEYINFMLTEEVAIANAEWIMYASPNTLVTENEDYIASMEECHEDVMTILYNKESSFPVSYYRTLDPATQSIENTLWEELKTENSIELWIHVVSLIILVSVISVIAGLKIRKKKRAKFY